MKIKPEKKCAVCRKPATCSMTTLISTVGHVPRLQKASRGVLLCSRCIRVWACLMEQTIGNRIAATLDALSVKYARLHYKPEPQWLFVSESGGVFYREDASPEEIARTSRPHILAPSPKKKRVENPDSIRVRLRFVEKDVIVRGLQRILDGHSAEDALRKSTAQAVMNRIVKV